MLSVSKLRGRTQRMRRPRRNAAEEMLFSGLLENWFGARRMEGSKPRFRGRGVELLEFLSQAWPYLSLEEGYPLALQPPRPSLLRAAAEWRMAGANGKAISQRRERGVQVRGVPRTPRAVQGAFHPRSGSSRRGLDVGGLQTQRGREAGHRSCSQLMAIGEAIKGRLATCDDIRAQAAIKDWDARALLTQVELAGIATRIPAATIKQLAAGTSACRASEKIARGLPTHRSVGGCRLLVGSLASTSIEQVMSDIVSLPKIDAPEFDQLTDAAKAVIDGTVPKKPYDEGYALAAWFRRTRKISESAPVEPEEILKDLRVLIKATAIPDERLDAFACWGPRHGPAVVINRSGKHARASLGGGQHSLMNCVIC